MYFTTIKNRFIFSILVFIGLMFGITAVGTYYYFEYQTSQLIQSQQFSMLTTIAKGLDEKLASSHKNLIAAARVAPHKIFNDHKLAQSWIDDRPSLKQTFNNGLFLFTPEGKLQVENPYLPGRQGKDFSFRDYYKKTVATGKPYISLPYPSSKGGHPAIMMTVPIFAADGHLLGILGGAMDLLAQGSIFKSLIETKIGKNGYLYLYAHDRTMIVHPTLSRIMQKDVLPGMNRLFDKAIEGFEGSGKTITSKGLHVISSFKHLETTDWILAANYPVAEAYHPIHVFRNYYLFGILILILSSVVLARRLGSGIAKPLTDLVEQIQYLVQANEQSKQQLVCNRSDELKLLADSFNTLLAEMGQRELLLLENRKRLADIIDFLPDATLAIDREKRIIIWNHAIEKMTGIPASEMLGKGDYAYTVPFYGEARPQLMDLIFEYNEQLTNRYVNIIREGNSFSAEVFCNALFNNKGAWLFVKAAPLLDQSGTIIGVIEIIRDITDQKRSDEELRNSEEQLSSILKTAMDGFLMTDMEGRFLQTNDTYCQMIGYSKEELLHMSILDIDSVMTESISRML
ncbi:MAG: PAS domain S-box protein, partial [Deltaproteobacteria bacterium]